MSLQEREYMRSDRREQDRTKLTILPSLPKPPKPLSYWVSRLIFILAGLELALFLARFLK